jgi:hypothetical protein
MELKLFVWDNFNVCVYNGGLAFAIDENEIKAKKQIIKRLGYNPNSWGNLNIYSCDEKICRAIVGGK